ncbi:MAG: hypothetical protein NT031_11110 [Planctomycetota bacterium]|nr:hypothetical protein [Planctomycetota bacterium]
MNPSRARICLWSAIAAAALLGAGLLQKPIDERMEKEDRVAPGNVVAQNHPQAKLLTNVFGGLRSVMMATLWIRANKAHQEGNHYDALQLADLICELEPYSPGVWDYQAWQMAWNISVTKRTGEERWRWVYNGAKLLRDKGLMINPRSIILYRELSWIFLDKMGADMDEQHAYYKRRWAYLMQRVLGAPPLGDYKAVADAFRPIAQAPLDRHRRRQGLRDGGVFVLQGDQLRTLAAGDKAVAAYLGALDRAGWTPWDDRGRLTSAAAYSLLDSYGELSAMNDPAAAAARGKLLAFLRAQLLWNEYKLDPAVMLRMMEEDYQCPLDWRAPFAHGLYWADMGIAMAKNEVSVEEDSTDWLNTVRNELNSLKTMAMSYGRMFYSYNPGDPENPRLQWFPDPRFIEVVHRKMTQRARESRQQDLAELGAVGIKSGLDDAHGFAQNKLRDGHVNFLLDAVMMLCAYGWQSDALHYYEELRRLYDPDKNLYTQGLAQFFDERFRDPGPETAKTQLTGSLAGGFYSLTYDAKASHYRDARQWAQVIWNRFLSRTAERARFTPGLEVLAGGVLGQLAVEPRTHGYVIGLWQRSQMYKQTAQLWPTVRDPDLAQKVAYSPTYYAYQLILANRPVLERLAAREKLKFDELFPKPDGYDAFAADMLDQERRQDFEADQPRR